MLGNGRKQQHRRTLKLNICSPNTHKAVGPHGPQKKAHGASNMDPTQMRKGGLGCRGRHSSKSSNVREEMHAVLLGELVLRLQAMHHILNPSLRGTRVPKPLSDSPNSTKVVTDSARSQFAGDESKGKVLDELI